MSATGLDVFDKTLQTTNSGSIKFPRRTVPTESSHGKVLLVVFAQAAGPDAG
jgi:hypothetical protein